MDRPRQSASSMSENDITGIIVDTSIDIHRRLGPGLLEAIYRDVLAHELRKRGLCALTEQPVPLYWDGVLFELAYRADLLVEDRVIVELKSAERIAPAHLKQLLTYLRVADKRVGLLINFGAVLLKDGIHRVVNRLDESPPQRARKD